MKKHFNPQEWLNNNYSEVDKVIARIEAALTDIATNYSDWLNVGFAFADEFGEAGRKFFHRTSRFYPGYTKNDTDNQYDQCLKANGHGITIKTFFHLAKQAGIDIKGTSGVSGVSCDLEATMYRGRTGASDVDEEAHADEDACRATIHRGLQRPFILQRPSNLQPPEEADPSPTLVLPTLPDALFDHLPRFLKRVVERSTSSEERDILLLGSLVTLSSCLNRVYGIYDDKKVYSNLFLFVTAQASAGKGRLVLCKNLVNPIHASLREQCVLNRLKYDTEIREFNLIKDKDLGIEKPEKPPELLLFIPANCSSTGVFQLLSDNGGHGLIFETEGDTLAHAFKTDYGNYSDGFRKAFHHESISYFRRTDREYVEINCPCLAALLSGTPRQITALIPSAEDGLFSRFMFYFMNIQPVWKNVFAKRNDQPLEDHFNDLGKEFFSLYKAMNQHPEIPFYLTDEQQEQFHGFFTQVQDKYLELLGSDYMGTVRRLGLIAFRLAMVITTLRILETGELPDKMECSDEDFQTVCSMIRVLVRHASHVYSELPQESKAIRPKNKKELFLEGLPLRFTRQEYLEIARRIGLNEKTTDRQIDEFCKKCLIMKEKHGCYRNLTLSQDRNDEEPEAIIIDI